MESHHIYVTSTSDQSLYNNSSSGFTNNIPTLTLDVDKEYEVGLLSALLPQRYYMIEKDGPGAKVHLEFGIYESDGSVTVDTVPLPMNDSVLSNDLEYYIALLNTNIELMLRSLLNIRGEYKEYPLYEEEHPSYPPPLLLEEGTANPHLIYHTLEGNHHCIKYIHMLVGDRVADILGLDSSDYYPLFRGRTKEEEEESTQPITIDVSLSTPYRTKDKKSGLDIHLTKAFFPALRQGDIQYLLIYSDLVNPSRFSGQNVNILDAYSLSDGVSKGVHPTIYKSLKPRIIDSVSIKITDQRGRPVHFDYGCPVTCLLHIRTKRVY